MRRFIVYWLNKLLFFGNINRLEFFCKEDYFLFKVMKFFFCMVKGYSIFCLDEENKFCYLSF